MRTDIDASFTPAQIPEEDKAPTDEVDPVFCAGSLCSRYSFAARSLETLTITMLALPRGSTVKIVTTHGASFWAIVSKEGGGSPTRRKRQKLLLESLETYCTALL